MVWYGVVWCGVVCSVVWYGMIWYGICNLYVGNMYLYVLARAFHVRTEDYSYEPRNMYRHIFAVNLQHCKVGCKFVTIFATNNSIRKCICKFVANLVIFVIFQVF